jgi:hypothetical protein
MVLAFMAIILFLLCFCVLNEDIVSETNEAELHEI